MEKMILLFDSGCKLCNSSIKFVTKGDPQQKIKQIALQSIQGQEILAAQPYLLDVNSIILIVNDKVFIESDAILQIAQHLSFPYKLLAAGIIVPKKWRDAIYRWIAKNRYKWFGKI
ncbi:MAG: DCC1-like thiol-disulfide oxidoreductase family protein [Bacteroidetes bacterium]|nr:DCC1-like thiol-disulfide oxidoreductase family protein [Bacteroidota bacterium]